MVTITVIVYHNYVKNIGFLIISPLSLIRDILCPCESLILGFSGFQSLWMWRIVSFPAARSKDSSQLGRGGDTKPFSVALTEMNWCGRLGWHICVPFVQSEINVLHITIFPANKPWVWLCVLCYLCLVTLPVPTPRLLQLSLITSCNTCWKKQRIQKSSAANFTCMFEMSGWGVCSICRKTMEMQKWLLCCYSAHFSALSLKHFARIYN